jgi:hypothetical protein
MKNMKTCTRFATALLISTSALANAALDLKPRHSDEPAEYTFNKRFSMDSALNTVQHLRSILTSFQTMTRMTKDKLTAKELQDIGNTEWDTQHLGFANHPNVIEGTLLKQDYLIKKLEYDLALERSKSGKVTAEELSKAQKDFKMAEGAFQRFWDKFGVAD